MIRSLGLSLILVLTLVSWHSHAQTQPLSKEEACAERKALFDALRKKTDAIEVKWTEQRIFPSKGLGHEQEVIEGVFRMKVPWLKREGGIQYKWEATVFGEEITKRYENEQLADTKREKVRKQFPEIKPLVKTVSAGEEQLLPKPEELPEFIMEGVTKSIHHKHWSRGATTTTDTRATGIVGSVEITDEVCTEGYPPVPVTTKLHVFLGELHLQEIYRAYDKERQRLRTPIRRTPMPQRTTTRTSRIIRRSTSREATTVVPARITSRR